MTTDKAQKTSTTFRQDCSIRCTMTCAGDIKRVELVKSSGYDSLDKAGIRARKS